MWKSMFVPECVGTNVSALYVNVNCCSRFCMSPCLSIPNTNNKSEQTSRRTTGICSFWCPCRAETQPPCIICPSATCGCIKEPNDAETGIKETKWEIILLQFITAMCKTNMRKTWVPVQIKAKKKKKKGMIYDCTQSIIFILNIRKAKVM